MRKYMKIVLLASVLTLVLAFSLALAADVETREEFIPLRTRVMEILQENPEILKEIEAMREEYGAWAKREFAESEDGFFGRMRGRMSEEYGAWAKREFAESEDGFFGRMRGRMSEGYGALAKREFAESEDGFFGKMRGRMGEGYCHGQGRVQKRQHMRNRW